MYDDNAPLEEVFPGVQESYKEELAGRRLKDFCRDMHGFLREASITDLIKEVYAGVPDAEMIPADAYDRLVKGEAEQVPLKALADRTSAAMVVPYPPGIPVVMPGEKFTQKSRKIVDYLKLCEEFDNRFPGFENEMQGIIIKKQGNKNNYNLYCVTKSKKAA